MLFLLACNLSTPGISGQLGEGDTYALTFGAEEGDDAWAVSALAGGGAVVGTHQAAPESLADVWIAQLDADGVVEWSTSWGGESAEQVRSVHVGSEYVYVAGATWLGFGDESADAFVLALDPDSGSLAWAWTSGLEGFERAESVVERDGVLYFSGWSTSNGNDAMVGALDAGGELAWLTAYDSGGWDEANGSLVIADDALFVTGLRDGDAEGVGGSGMLARFALDGTLAWAEDLPDCPSYCRGMDLASDGDAIYGIGTALDGAVDEMDLHRFDTDGGAIWSTRYNGLGVATGAAIDLRDGVLRAAGTTEGNGGDIVVIDVEPESGAVGVVATWAGRSDDTAHGLSIGEDAVWVVGQTESAGAGSTDGLLLHLPTDLGAVPPTE